MRAIISWNEEYLDLSIVRKIEGHEDPKQVFRDFVIDRISDLCDVDKNQAEAWLDEEPDMIHLNIVSENEANASIYYQGFIEFLRLVNIQEKETTRSHTDTMELIGSIIDIFDDFLEDRDVRIPTSDREMRESGDWDVNFPGENHARIYGSDYDELAIDIAETLGLDY